MKVGKTMQEVVSDGVAIPLAYVEKAAAAPSPAHGIQRIGTEME